MGLLIWLPLNGNLENQGLSDLKFSLVGTDNSIVPTNTGGKIVPGSYKRQAKTYNYIISNKSFSLPGDATICCWAKVTSISDAATANGLITHHGHNYGGLGITVKDISTSDWRMSINTGLNGDLQVNGASDRTYNHYYGNTNIKDAWHHLCLTYQASTKQIRMYVDGKLDANVITVNGNNTNARPFALFAWSTDHLGPSINNYRPNCELNDVRVYDECLSPQEVKEISKGLRLHYQMKSSRFDNLLSRDEMYVYNNYGGSGTTGSITPTGEEFMGSKVYRLTMTPNASSLDSFKTQKWGHGINTGGRTFAANTAYHYSIFYRPVSHTDVIVGGTASNINGWTEIAPTYWGDGWYQVGQRRVQGGTAQSDSIYTSFYTSSAAAGVPIVIDFCCQSLLAGTTDIVQDFGSNEYNKTIETDTSGYNIHATVNGKLTNDPGAPKYRGGYWFGTSQYLRIPTSSYEGMANSYTFSWWASNSDMNGKMAWGFEDGNRLNLYPSSWFNWNTGNGSENSFRDSGGNNVNFTTYNGGWHHYVVTGNGSKTTLYIDGVARGTAKSYVGITGTKLIISGWDTSGSYKWNGGLCDFRLYATCLSAEDVKDLYSTGAIITNTGTLMATEFSEFEVKPEVDINKFGTLRAESFTAHNAQVANMKLKALPDGSVWARIYKHDIRRTANWFNASQTQKISTGNRYSQMNLVDTFKASDGTYEFMWTQPEEEIYCPSGYTRLDCVESTGNQYIRTGVYPYQDGDYVRGHRWEFDMSFKTDGVRQLMGYGPNGGEYWGMAASNLYEKTSVPAGGRDAIVHDYSGGTAGGNSLWVKYGSCGQGSNLATSQEYTLFALNWSGGPGYYSKNKLYRCKCWKGKEKIRDFIPVRRHSDNCVGLYDLVTRKFYAPSGGPLLGHEIDKYIPLEYLEFTGTQHIDTGFASSTGFIFDLKWSYNSLSGHYIVGAHNEASPYGRNGVGMVGNTYWELGTGESCPSSSTTVAVNTPYVLYGSTVIGNSYLNVNGSRVISTSDSTTRSLHNILIGTNQYSLYHSGGRVSGKLYYLKLYDSNGILMRDFIPVYSTLNQRNGLYDKLNHKFYGSVTRDNFYAGPTTCEDPSSLYEFYEYIASIQGNGQYINTGYNPTNNTSIYIKATPVNGTSIFGCAQGGHYFNMTSSGDLARTYFYWGNQGHRDAFINSIGNQTHYFTLDNSRSTFNGNTLGTYSNYSFSIGYPIILFARNVDGGIGDIGACRIYECDIYESGVLQRSFHPAKRKSDGAVGMYDAVTGGFYTNSGSGSWLTGPRIYKEPIPQYNRWRQTNSPNTCAAATGVGFISSSWLTQFNGLVKFHNSGTCDYCCDTHNGTWYAPLGQRSVWEGGIPGAHGGMIKSTELWVRVDRLEAANNLAIVKPNTIACKNYMEI